MKELIYLASPYTSKTEFETKDRVACAEDATARLIEAGHLIFSPIVHSHPIAALVSFDARNSAAAMSPWMDYDRAMIDKADELWVLMLKGFDRSLGVTEEVNHALKQGMDVTYLEYPSLRKVGTINKFSLDPIEIPKAPGAGSFYSPNSTGEAPVKKFAAETHTPYARGDRVRIIADTSPQDKHGLAIGEVSTIKHLAESRGCDPVPRYTVDNEYLVRHSDIEPVIRIVQCYTCGEKVEYGVGCVECNEKAKAKLDRLIGALGTYRRVEKTYDALKTETQTTSLPDDADERNSYPMAEGLLYYFPNALAEVSKVSAEGAKQHGLSEMHWSRGKSTDHANKIIRHLIDAGKDSEQSIAHSANLAWRSLALLQEQIERVRNIPLPKNAWVDSDE